MAPPFRAEDSGRRTGEGGVSALATAALLIGIVCVAITCYVVCYAELVVGKIQIGFLQLPPVVVGMLVLLLGAQAILARLASGVDRIARALPRWPRVQAI